MSDKRPKDCASCKKPTTQHLVQNINGVLKEFDMCKDCPHAESLDDPKGFSLANIFLGMGEKKEEEGERREKDDVCSSCGFTLANFKKAGRLGCPYCYKTFSAGLFEALNDMHKDIQHTGKTPPKFIKRKELQNILTSLKKDLQSSIQNEKYEEAAKIRDKILALEKNIS